MSILIAAIGAMLIGTGDFLGRRASMGGLAMPAARWATGMGGFVALGAGVFIPSRLQLGDLGLGLGSGVAAAVALMILYHALVVCSPAIVTAVAAVTTAGGPVIIDAVGGADFSGLVWAGAAVSIIGLALTSWSGEVGQRPWTAIGFGLVSGSAFAVALTLLSATSDGGGVWPTVAQRLTGAGFITVVMAVTGTKGFDTRTQSINRKWGAVAGIVVGVGVLAVNIAIKQGPLGPVAVAGSLFPAMTVLLVTFVDKEPLRWWQGAGIATVLAGIACISLG